MRHLRGSKEAEKGRHKERIEKHVQGRPKDHTSNMQSEFREKAKTRRYGIPCDTENSVSPKTRNSVWNGIPCVSEKHEIPCVGGKMPKIRKHGNPSDTKIRVSWRKHGNPCESTKTRKSVWRVKNAETPNSRNSATCSKTSGTRPELRTSESLDIRKDGENRRLMQNRILEQVSSARRQTSGPTLRVTNEGSDTDKAWSWKGSKPKTRRASS
jgi:hypothetical protein